VQIYPESEFLGFGALPFKKAGKIFLVILGMDFIKNFDLEIKAYEKGILLRRPTP
jgi:hypothetical protein